MREGTFQLGLLSSFLKYVGFLVKRHNKLHQLYVLISTDMKVRQD